MLTSWLFVKVQKDIVLPAKDDHRHRANPLPGATLLTHIEQVDEANWDVGWRSECRQLQPESFRAQFALHEHSGIVFQLERYNGRIELQTEPPPGMLTVILADTANDRASANGLPIDSRDMLVMAPGSELHATTPAEVDAYSLHIPQSRFAEAAYWLSPGRAPGPRAGVMSFRADPAAMDDLRQAVIRVNQPHLPETTRKQCSLNLVARIIEMTTESDGVSYSTDRNSSRRALRRAREYIEDHLAHPICMADVCRYSGASNRTLLRLFRRELDMPPTQYILARRLNAARRILLASDPNLARVADIGYNHGLDHLGRFASSYRAYFDETPRQTLQRRDESRRKA